MEDWSWPPRYDPSYRPPEHQAYWFPVRETLDPEIREARILERIQKLMRYAWERAPFYRRKWAAAGLEPADIRSLAEHANIGLDVGPDAMFFEQLA